MSEIKITLVSSKYPPEYSGSGHRAHWLYQRLRNSHPEINLRVICGAEQFNENAVYEFEGVSVARIACKPCPVLRSGVMRYIYNARNFAAESRATMAALRNSQKPDLLHVFGKTNVTATAIDFANREGIPLLLELCNEMAAPWQYVPFPYSLRFTEKPEGRFRLVCISPRMAGMCRANGIDEKQIWCRPNPVDEKRFHPVNQDEKNSIRERLTRFSASDKLIVYIAKYKQRKNHLLLLEAIKKLPGEYKLFIGGPLATEGRDRDFAEKIRNGLDQAAADPALKGRIQVVHGYRTDMDECYKMADVYAFPTLEEGLGTPMLESIACATPVVGNLIPGVTDAWINSGENGFICDLSTESGRAGFPQKLMEAAIFPPEQRERESRKMLAIAGTSHIDAEYWKTIQETVSL